MKKQIDYFGWDVKEHRTVIHPWCENITDWFNLTRKGIFETANAFSCTREHYTLIKSAYLRGLDSICIMEDDVSFITNKSIWEEYLNNLPEDWDVLRICSLRGGYEQKYTNGYLWHPVRNEMWGTGCYALNRKGMEYMLNTIDSFMQPIDRPLAYYKSDPNIKHYLPHIPLGLCLEDSLSSDISSKIDKCKLYFKDITDISLNNYRFGDELITNNSSTGKQLNDVEELKLPFEKIYCLHLSESKNRYNEVLKEFKKINLVNEVDFWYTCKKPINENIGNSIQSLHDKYYNKLMKNNKYIYGAVFDCSYNHYSIIKQSYIRGFDSILIIEDDIHFNDNIELLNNIINNIPNDYDVLKFYNTKCLVNDNKASDDYFELLNENNYKNYYHSTLCYALSRKGMETIIKEYETDFVASDIALNKIRLNKDIKFYVLKSNQFCMQSEVISTIVK
jgi:GR25 family glycosyltransferase involved in LPS biosynthesis